MYLPSGTDIKLAFSGISDLVKKWATPELQEKITGLREMIQGLRETCVELREENMTLKKRLEEKESVFYSDGVYWVKNEDGKNDGPFCLPCYDNKGKLVRLTKDSKYYKCPVKDCTFYHKHTDDGDTSNSCSRGPADTIAGY